MAALAGLLVWPSATGQRPQERVLRVGPGQPLPTLAQALRLAGPGDTIELLAGEYRADVGVLDHPGVTLRGLGAGAVLHADGKHAEGKAILVVRSDVTIENVEFRGCRVPSGNGAGIRFEAGRLELRRCRFFDNEMGVLTANGPAQELDVVDCQFGQAPRHDGPLHHLLYVGSIRRLLLQGSQFSDGWHGHLVKSRARANRVQGNLLADGPLGEASYELEFPDGGDNVVTGNVIVQNRLSRNPALLSMGAEAKPGMSGSLLLAHNTLVNDGVAGGRFVHLWADRLAGTTRVTMVNNLFVGPGELNLPNGSDAAGNLREETAALRSPARGDYRPRAAAAATSVRLPTAALPLREFLFPAGSRPITTTGRLMVGAQQDAP